jgi:hypothetical protein
MRAIEDLDPGPILTTTEGWLLLVLGVTVLLWCAVIAFSGRAVSAGGSPSRSTAIGTWAATAWSVLAVAWFVPPTSQLGTYQGMFVGALIVGLLAGLGDRGASYRRAIAGVTLLPTLVLTAVVTAYALLLGRPPFLIDAEVYLILVVPSAAIGAAAYLVVLLSRAVLRQLRTLVATH